MADTETKHQENTEESGIVSGGPSDTIHEIPEEQGGVPAEEDDTTNENAAAVTTSLGGVKKQFFQSRRAQHLLDCKGLLYYLVDANSDVSIATDSKDRELFDKWKKDGILKSTKDTDGTERVIIPQLIVDSVPLGDDRAIQDLEDDGDLDYIVARLLCPACLSEKSSELTKCDKCNVQCRSIIPQEYIDSSSIRRYYQGQIC